MVILEDKEVRIKCVDKDVYLISTLKDCFFYTYSNNPMIYNEVLDQQLNSCQEYFDILVSYFPILALKSRYMTESKAIELFQTSLAEFTIIQYEDLFFYIPDNLGKALISKGILGSSSPSRISTLQREFLKSEEFFVNFINSIKLTNRFLFDTYLNEDLKKKYKDIIIKSNEVYKLFLDVEIPEEEKSNFYSKFWGDLNLKDIPKEYIDIKSFIKNGLEKNYWLKPLMKLIDSEEDFNLLCNAVGKHLDLIDIPDKFKTKEIYKKYYCYNLLPPELKTLEFFEETLEEATANSYQKFFKLPYDFIEKNYKKLCKIRPYFLDPDSSDVDLINSTLENGNFTDCFTNIITLNQIDLNCFYKGLDKNPLMLFELPYIFHSIYEKEIETYILNNITILNKLHRGVINTLPFRNFSKDFKQKFSYLILKNKYVNLFYLLTTQDLDIALNHPDLKDLY